MKVGRSAADFFPTHYLLNDHGLNCPVQYLGECLIRNDETATWEVGVIHCESFHSYRLVTSKLYWERNFSLMDQKEETTNA